MKIFVAGARSITELDDDMQERVNSICDKNNDIIVGDSYGVDAAVQELCAKRGYSKVTVYAINGDTRNNVGNWPVKEVEVDASVKGFDFYRQKDISISRDAECGYMIWDGESKGTLCNIISLALQNKLVLVRLAQVKKTVQIRTADGADISVFVRIRKEGAREAIIAFLARFIKSKKMERAYRSLHLSLVQISWGETL